MVRGAHQRGPQARQKRNGGRGDPEKHLEVTGSRAGSLGNCYNLR